MIHLVSGREKLRIIKGIHVRGRLRLVRLARLWRVRKRVGMVRKPRLSLSLRARNALISVRYEVERRSSSLDNDATSKPLRKFLT